MSVATMKRFAVVTRAGFVRLVAQEGRRGPVVAHTSQTPRRLFETYVQASVKANEVHDRTKGIQDVGVVAVHVAFDLGDVVWVGAEPPVADADPFLVLRGGTP